MGILNGMTILGKMNNAPRVPNGRRRMRIYCWRSRRWWASLSFCLAIGRSRRRVRLEGVFDENTVDIPSIIPGDVVAGVVRWIWEIWVVRHVKRSERGHVEMGGTRILYFAFEENGPVGSLARSPQASVAGTALSRQRKWIIGHSLQGPEKKRCQTALDSVINDLIRALLAMLDTISMTVIDRGYGQ